jgi:hypothetical protein
MGGAHILILLIKENQTAPNSCAEVLATYVFFKSFVNEVIPVEHYAHGTTEL